MTDVNTLIRRIDQELEEEVKRQKAAWAEVARTNRERGPQLQHYEEVAKRLIELLKPRLAAFVNRFEAVVKTQPLVREHTRAMTLTFAATVAKVTLTFEVFPDEDVSHIRLECTQEIIPALVLYDKQSVLEFPLDAVQDDAVVQWFDERIVAFVKAYLSVVRQDTALQEHLKDQSRRGSRRKDSLSQVPRRLHSGARRPDLLLRGRGHSPGVRERTGDKVTTRGDIHPGVHSKDLRADSPPMKRNDS